MIIGSHQPDPVVIRKLIVFGNLMATLLTKYADDLDETSGVDPTHIERTLPQGWANALLEFRKEGKG